MIHLMNSNMYGEVINGEKTYKYIAKNIKSGQPTLIGWTDEEYTHYDILFAYDIEKDGYTQGGIEDSDLYVSIMRIGAFGFKTNNEKYPGYIAEKLFCKNIDSSIEKVTELINGVIKNLNE